jgi:hypothetical protein
MQRSVRAMAVSGALFLLMTGMASAAEICANGTVSPGQESCLGPLSANSSMEATGTGFGKQLRFRVYWQDIYGNKTLIDDGPESLTFTGVWDDGTSPSLFPGQFIVCAKRPGSHTEPASYRICLNPDSL